MAKKTFALGDLNAVGDALGTVEAAFNPTQPTDASQEDNHIEQEKGRAAQSEEPEEKDAIEQPTLLDLVQPAKESVEMTEETAKRGRKKSAKAAKPEETKMIGIPVPKSLFKKLTLMKLATDKPIRQICLELIEEGLENYNK